MGNYDMLAREEGRKRNKYHVYRQPFGYPIRLCDWVSVDSDKLWVAFMKYPESGTLKNAIYRELRNGGKICKHCQAVVMGDRSSVGVNDGA